MPPSVYLLPALVALLACLTLCVGARLHPRHRAAVLRLFVTLIAIAALSMALAVYLGEVVARAS